MIKFFRHIRMQLLETGKTTRYLKYAVGEIILVVIGILIALSINNWNETRKAQLNLNNVLDIVKTDLIKDTLKISNIIRIYEQKNTLLSKIFENKDSKFTIDSITETNYKKYLPIIQSMSTYNFFVMQNKGMELLKDISTITGFENDTLIINLIDTHSTFERYFISDNEILEKLVYEYNEENSKYPWFLDLNTDKYNIDMFEYFYHDSTKGNAIRFKIYLGQFLSDLKMYKNAAKSYIEDIEKRLQIK